MSAAEPAPPGFSVAAWKAPAVARWSFRHTDAFLPTRIVPAGAMACPLPRAPLDLRGLVVHAPDGDRTLTAALAETHATAFLVLHRGMLVVERYAAPMRPGNRHMLFSITKSVTGLLALALIEAGVVDPARAAADYVAELAGTAFGAATLADLLAMRDGVAFDESYADPDAEIHRYSDAYWRDAPGGVLAAIRAIGGDAAATPGAFVYRTPVADVVGWVLRRAAGASLAAMISALLWAPMGAAAAAHCILDTAGHEIAGTGLNATAPDLARLALLLLDGGAWNGRRILSAAALDKLFAGRDERLALVGHPHRPGWSYRDLWWRPGGEAIVAIGVHGQRLWVDRRRALAIVHLGAAPLPDNAPTEPLHDAIVTAIRQRLADAPAGTPLRDLACQV